MTWNNSATTTIEGPCSGICGQHVKKRVSLATAKHTKRICCGGDRCKRHIARQRDRDYKARVKA